MKMVSTYNWLVIQYVDDSGLDLPHYQRWYESLEFIGTHLLNDIKIEDIDQISSLTSMGF